VVTRGAKKPLSLATKSKIAELLGVRVPIPTLFCAKAISEINSNEKRENRYFIRGVYFFIGHEYRLIINRLIA
jgi:hypothetical protein